MRRRKLPRFRGGPPTFFPPQGRTDFVLKSWGPPPSRVRLRWAVAPQRIVFGCRLRLCRRLGPAFPTRARRSHFFGSPLKHPLRWGSVGCSARLRYASLRVCGFYVCVSVVFAVHSALFRRVRLRVRVQCKLACFWLCSCSGSRLKTLGCGHAIAHASIDFDALDSVQHWGQLTPLRPTATGIPHGLLH